MEDRGRELSLQEQTETQLLLDRGTDRLPQGMPRLCRTLAEGAARGIQAPRRRGRLGAPLHDNELPGRSADRARADEVRAKRNALSRLEAGDVVGGGKDCARRSRGRIRGLHQRYDLGEVSGTGLGGNAKT